MLGDLEHVHPDASGRDVGERCDLLEGLPCGCQLILGDWYAGIPARRRHTKGSLSLGMPQQVNWIARHLQTKSGSGSASASTTCMPSVIARLRSMFAPRDRSHPGSRARMSQSISRLIPSRMNAAHGDPR
ncbi:hypothetical protein A6R75_17480 [Pseudomonas aeruginosa]|nr:hypothetical protein A6R75_17480 [Pseudomonas aeruginosa]